MAFFDKQAITGREWKEKKNQVTFHRVSDQYFSQKCCGGFLFQYFWAWSCAALRIPLPARLLRREAPKKDQSRFLCCLQFCHVMHSLKTFLDNLTYTLALWLSSSHSDLCNLCPYRREKWVSENFLFFLIVRTWFTSLCKNRPPQFKKIRKIKRRVGYTAKKLSTHLLRRRILNYLQLN